MTLVAGALAISAIAAALSAPLRGRNPEKYSLSVGSADIIHAVSAAFAPGSTSNGALFSENTRTSLSPGSDTAGIPASLMNATAMPLRTLLSISSAR